MRVWTIILLSIVLSLGAIVFFSDMSVVRLDSGIIDQIMEIEDHVRGSGLSNDVLSEKDVVFFAKKHKSKDKVIIVESCVKAKGGREIEYNRLYGRQEIGFGFKDGFRLLFERRGVKCRVVDIYGSRKGGFVGEGVLLEPEGGRFQNGYSLRYVVAKNKP